MNDHERELIAAIDARIAAAYEAGDADAIAAQYTEDAVLTGPDLSLTGREAIAEIYRGYLATTAVDLHNEVEEVEVVGDGWAYVRGRLRVRSTPKDGGPIDQRTGKYLAVARRGEDGVWRFARDLYVLDSPET